MPRLQCSICLCWEKQGVHFQNLTQNLRDKLKHAISKDTNKICRSCRLMCKKIEKMKYHGTSKAASSRRLAMLCRLIAYNAEQDGYANSDEYILSKLTDNRYNQLQGALPKSSHKVLTFFEDTKLQQELNVFGLTVTQSASLGIAFARLAKDIKMFIDHSHYRATFISYAVKTELLSVELIAMIFGVSERYVIQCSHLEVTADNDIFTKQSQLITRIRSHNDINGLIIDIVKELCLTKSGCRTENYFLYFTWRKLIERVKEIWQEKAIDFLRSRSEKEINELEKNKEASIMIKQMQNGLRLNTPGSERIKRIATENLNIRHIQTYWGQFDCPKCARFHQVIYRQRELNDQDEKNTNEIKELENLTSELNILQLHSRQYPQQRELYRKHKQNMKDTDCVIVMDFTKVKLEKNISEISVAINMFVICVMRIINGEVSSVYYDFTDNQGEEKNDFFFVRSGLLIDEFSRSVFVGISIEHHFFVSYHGHSECDAHKGKLNQVLHQFLIKHQFQRNKIGKSAISEPLSLIKNGEEFCSSELLKSLSNVEANVINIERDKELKQKVKSLPKGIKKFHFFSWLEAGFVDCAEMVGMQIQ
jgi:hypothetical protein